MKRILLKSVKSSIEESQYVLLDDEDYKILKWYVWRPFKSNNSNYARATINGKRLSMHCMILPSDNSKLSVDHIDGNGLNNQKSNLRFATKAQQMHNTKKLGGCVSKFKGVYFSIPTQKWVARITVKGKNKSLGYYLTEDQAAEAYNIAAEKYFGGFANLNELV